MADRFNIRRCNPIDASALALLGQATFLETFAGILDGTSILAHCESQHATRVYDAWLQDATTSIWIAETEVGNAPIGYLVLAKSTLPLADLHADDLEVKRIYLLHRFHGSGVGKRLMAEAISQAKLVDAPRLLLGVYANNHDAIAFYIRQGFRKIGERVFNVGGKNYDDVMLVMDI
ncbi:GNAT family N-acetyltransferase [Pseudolysobacter antarcticus]|uniref:GNAT family N-acetyltransferase n=1 Tax=Pseudolysobacter antarcticus TaxID=2511995 RepID=A0A411HLP7_9GAMM|nr:GNAT family N-acetyltransferase [Pseudolysobacter antarcticus]QBB71297.1 GNAT family N-acetyltransferase [Pseudolysobacter antarcticus]